MFLICGIYRFFKILAPSCVWHLPNTKNEIYLTFDDGPHPTITPWVINELEKVNAKATFFMVGENVNRFPKTLDLVLKNGHKIGNHTHTHIKGWNSSTADYEMDIKTNIITTNLFRPPYGRITRSQIRNLKNNFSIIMWSLLSKDYNKQISITRTLKKLKRKTKAGSIIVFHDSEKAEKQLKALLPNYLAYCKEKGFVMQIIS